MQKQILFCVVAIVGISALWGCSSDDKGPTTAADKKNFSGGEMPADARAKFEATQKQNADALADRVAKARAGAAAGGGQ